MKNITNFIYENKSMNGLSSLAKIHAKEVLNILQVYDNKYKDWDKITMTVRKVGNKFVSLIYYDNKFIDAFDPKLMPSDPDIVDELGWAHMGKL